MKNITKRVTALALAVLFALTAVTGCSPKKEETQIGLSSSVTSLSGDASFFETVVSLTGLTWDKSVTAEQIELSGAFSGMTLKDVERMDETQVKVSAEGELDGAESGGFISFASDTIIDTSAPPEVDSELTEEEKEAKEQMEMQEKTAFPYSVKIAILRPQAEISVENTDGKEAVVTLHLTDDIFQGELKPEFFTVAGDEKTLSIKSVERTDDSTCKLTFAQDANVVFAALGNGTIKVAAEAMKSGKELKAAFIVCDASLSATVDYVEEAEEGFLVTVILTLSNGTLADFDKSSFTLSGELSEIVSYEKEDSRHAAVKVTVKKENATLETLAFDGTLSIKGQWGKNLWGTDKKDAILDVHYNAVEGDKELLAIETSLAFDLLKTGIKSVASAVGSKAGSRLMEVISADMFGDKTAQQLDKLNNYLQQMDSKWTTTLGQISSHLSIMEDKIGQNNCSRVLDEFDTMADRLRSTVLHLENKKAAVDKATEGTPEYEKAKADFIAAVDKEYCKIYSEAHLLGKKIVSSSAGLAPGIMGTYDEMLSLIYNFDVQTYELKDEFRVFVLSLYMAAYDQAVLYYQLTDPNNRLLNDLEQQMVEVSKLLENMNVVRRTDDTAYCYAAGKTVKFKTGAMLGADKFSRSEIDGTAAEKMIKRAEYRSTTLGADLDACGFYWSDKKNSFTSKSHILVVDLKYYDKRGDQKNEWWTTMTKVDVTTHKIQKDVKTYYQRQERNWFEALFDMRFTQKECWGVYDYIGLEIEKA